MTKSSMRGIFLSTIVILIGFAIIPSIHAETVNAKSIALEETTIIEFTNNGKEDVVSFRIWLGSDSSFKSFKTEKGWVGERTPQGVIIFTSSETVKPNESIKIGVTTDKITSGINWKALDKSENQIEIGKTVSEKVSQVKTDLKTDERKASENGVLSDSVFRIIPEKPNVGSTIRVTGEGFGGLHEFDFLIDSKKIGSFTSNDKGSFVTTMKIPENTNADRIDFQVKDRKGQEKSISLRLGAEDNKIPPTTNVKLTIKGIPDVIHRGDFLEISGTAQPNSAITAKIHNPDDEIINTRTSEVDSKGNWKIEPIIVPLDTPFGRYSAEISDGREQIIKNWEVETSKVILISPQSLKFDPGKTMIFNGTALPNIPIEIVLEDPLGIERFSDIIHVGSSGLVQFEYPTTANVDKEGTWTLVAKQGNNREFIFAGLGETPTIPVNLQFDKLNYKSSEKAKIAFTGKPSEILSMLIIDPSDKPKGDSIPIKLEADGRSTYELDLKGYTSGVYTAVISKGATKSSEVFTVGLQPGSGKINISTTKLDYEPGDSILILGSTNPNILLTITLYDPQGKEVKVKETFSDKNGKISEGSFRVPTNAGPGKWLVKASSGSNFHTADVNVTAVQQDGMVLIVEKGNEIAGVGKSITIKVLGARGTVHIDMVASDGSIIETLEFPSSGKGEINQPWIIPKDIVPGNYTIKASDAFNSAETVIQMG